MFDVCGYGVLKRDAKVHITVYTIFQLEFLPYSDAVRKLLSDVRFLGNKLSSIQSYFNDG